MDKSKSKFDAIEKQEQEVLVKESDEDFQYRLLEKGDF